MQARIRAFSTSNIQSGFAAAGLVPFDPDRVLSSLPLRPCTPPKAATIQEPVPHGTPYSTTQLDIQSAAMKSFLNRNSTSLPGLCLKQLIKGQYNHAHRLALLEDRVEKMEAIGKHRKKRAGPKRHISKKTTITVAEAQQLIQGGTKEPTQTPIAPNQEVIVSNDLPESIESQANRLGLPSCFICRGFDHLASECPKCH